MPGYLVSPQASPSENDSSGATVGAREVVPSGMEFELAVPRLRPASSRCRAFLKNTDEERDHREEELPDIDPSGPQGMSDAEEATTGGSARERLGHSAVAKCRDRRRVRALW